MYNLALAWESAGKRARAVADMRRAVASFRRVLAEDYRFAEELHQANWL